MGFVRRWYPKTLVCFSSQIPKCSIPSLVCFRFPNITPPFWGTLLDMTQLIKQVTTSFSPDEQYLVDYFLMRSWSPVEKGQKAWWRPKVSLSLQDSWKVPYFPKYLNTPFLVSTVSHRLTIGNSSSRTTLFLCEIITSYVNMSTLHGSKSVPRVAFLIARWICSNHRC